MAERVKRYAADPSQSKGARFTAKHTLDIIYDGKPTDQRYEVFEIGGTDPDLAASKTVFDTLTLIDQFSGGALAADLNRPRIVLSNGIRLIDNPNGGGEGLGFANPSFIFINVSGLREKAVQVGADFHKLLAVTAVHELLGHGLERNVMGDTDEYFSQYFNYSSEKSAGSLFKSIHNSIKSKDNLHAESQPVREYGRVSAGEDAATSVDASVGEAMGWNESTNKYPRMSSKVDSYRRDLVLQLMDMAAANVAKYDANPGFVGSEVQYTTNGVGVIVAEPVRKIEIRSVNGQEALQQEIAKQVQKHTPGGVFIINNEDIM